MQVIDCNVIKDLLPLYEEELASDSSRKIVEEHIEECLYCKKELEQMKEVIRIPQLPLLRSLKRILTIKTILTSVITMVVIVFLGMISFVYLNSPIELSEKESIQKIEAKEDGTLIIKLKDKVSGCAMFSESIKGENSKLNDQVMIYRCYTTLWHMITGGKGGSIIDASKNKLLAVYYCYNKKSDGTADYNLIYGTDQSGFHKYNNVPDFESSSNRTFINYFFISLLLSLILFFVHKTVRKTNHKNIALKLGLLPFSYAVSTVCIIIFVTKMDFNPTNITQVFTETLLLTIPIYLVFFLTMLAMKKWKRTKG